MRTALSWLGPSSPQFHVRLCCSPSLQAAPHTAVTHQAQQQQQRDYHKLSRGLHPSLSGALATTLASCTRALLHLTKLTPLMNKSNLRGNRDGGCYYRTR